MNAPWLSLATTKPDPEDLSVLLSHSLGLSGLQLSTFKTFSIFKKDCLGALCHNS